jgi:hypothetical protein
MTQQQTETLSEIHERLGSGVVTALNGLEDSLAEIDNKPASRYVKHLPDFADEDLRAQLVEQAREQDRQQLKDETQEILDGAIEYYQGQIAERRTQVETELKSLAEQSGELFRLAVAGDDELQKFADTVTTLGSEKHAAALFLVAGQRELVHVRESLAASLGGVFAEALHGPSPEHVERTAENQRRIVGERLAR